MAVFQWFQLFGIFRAMVGLTDSSVIISSLIRLDHTCFPVPSRYFLRVASCFLFLFSSSLQLQCSLLICLFPPPVNSSLWRHHVTLLPQIHNSPDPCNSCTANQSKNFGERCCRNSMKNLCSVSVFSLSFWPVSNALYPSGGLQPASLLCSLTMEREEVKLDSALLCSPHIS